MNYGFVDLHIHSTCSDGKYSPSELVKLAKKKGLGAVALTDHDTISGLEEFLEAGKKEEIETIPGVEIEAHEIKLGFSEVHLVGLFVDRENKALKDLLEGSSKQRELQKKKMVEKIASLGYKISFEEVKKIAGKEIGRPHIAKVLLKNNPEKFSSIDEIFEKLLIPGTPGYVEREKFVSFNEVVDTIHKAGGLVFFAHPFFFDKWREIVRYFAKIGGDGVETIASYPKEGHWSGLNIQDKVDSEWLYEMKNIMKEYGLIETGGTDYHGIKHWERELGGLNVPYSFVEKMKKRLGGEK
jgi:3',5'-nucleoside bisphosphate phosphatase